MKGLDQVLKNLKIEFDRMKRGAIEGVAEAGKIIYEDGDSTQPLIPEDLGNLKESYFVVTSDGNVTTGTSPQFDDGRGDAGKLSSGHSTALASAKSRARGVNPKAVFGFSAYYALIVHEMEADRDVRWTRPGSGSWFFWAAFTRNTHKVLEVIKQKVMIRT